MCGLCAKLKNSKKRQFFIQEFKELILLLLIVETWKKVTEWEIVKTEAGNEMEIFITLNKYNTRQQCENSTLC